MSLNITPITSTGSMGSKTEQSFAITRQSKTAAESLSQAKKFRETLAQRHACATADDAEAAHLNNAAEAGGPDDGIDAESETSADASGSSLPSHFRYPAINIIPTTVMLSASISSLDGTRNASPDLRPITNSAGLSLAPGASLVQQTGPKSMAVIDDGQSPTIGEAIRTGDANVAPNSHAGNAAGFGGGAIIAHNVAHNAAPPPLHGDAQINTTTQALLSEFETSINHFERVGNSWVGSAGLTFQSSVLHDVYVQITSDGKSLDILLTQSELTPMAFSLHRQERQLSDTLTRKMGRTVTLRVKTDSDIQAADDAEPQ